VFDPRGQDRTDSGFADRTLEVAQPFETARGDRVGSASPGGHGRPGFAGVGGAA